MPDRRGAAARIVCASLALAALLTLAVACGGGEEPSRDRTPEVSRPTTSPASTAVPATAAPTPAFTVTPTASLPTPTPAVTLIPQPEWSIRQQLSDDTLYVLIEAGLGADARVIAADEPELVEFEQWEIAFATDLDADGRHEAIVLHYTGGAHCCSEYLVFSSGADGIRAEDRFSLGNAGIGEVRDLDGDEVPELVAFDDRLAYFADLPYAASPFLPLVLCRSAEGPYYDCTPDFPQFLRDNARDYEELLQEAVQRQDNEEERRSAALGLYFSYLRLDMAEEGATRVRGLCPGCWQWLSENGSDVEERFAAEQPWRE